MSYKTSPYEQFLNWGLLDTKGSGQSRPKEYTIIAYNITNSSIFNEGTKIFNRKYPIREYFGEIVYENSQQALYSIISKYFKGSKQGTWTKKLNSYRRKALKIFEEKYHTEKAIQEFNDIKETLRRNPKTKMIKAFTSPEFDREGINLITYSFKSTKSWPVLDSQRYAIIFWRNPPPEPKIDKPLKDIEEDAELPYISNKWYEYVYGYERYRNVEKYKRGPYYKN